MSGRAFSETQRQQLADRGEALPDGSYPMPDCDGVSRAREAYGRAPESHRPMLRALINKRNRELNCGQPEFDPA